MCEKRLNNQNNHDGMEMSIWDTVVTILKVFISPRSPDYLCLEALGVF